MSERGLISREKGRWQLRVALKGIDLEVPKSLEQMIAVQIERLSAEEQRVLEEASVTGALFTTAVRTTAAKTRADSAASRAVHTNRARESSRKPSPE